MPGHSCQHPRRQKSLQEMNPDHTVVSAPRQDTIRQYVRYLILQPGSTQIETNGANECLPQSRTAVVFHIVPVRSVIAFTVLLSASGTHRSRQPNHGHTNMVSEPARLHLILHLSQALSPNC